MKILIVSDTHGYEENLAKAIETEKPFDMLLHLGDAEGNETKISYMIDQLCAFVIVAGNNDGFSRLDLEREFNLDGHRFFVTHGHHYRVSYGTDRIKYEAKKRGCDVVCFGHTHKPVIKKEEGILFLNPGSLTYPRTVDRMPSYLVLTTEKDGSYSYALKYVHDC